MLFPFGRQLAAVRHRIWLLPVTALPCVSSEVWKLCLVTALLNASYLSMMGLLKVLFVLRLGYDAGYVGSLFAAGSLSFALCTMSAGFLGAWIGPRRAMIGGVVLVAASMALLPFTEFVSPPLRPLWPLLVQVVSSAGWSVYMVNLVPALVAFSDDANRREVYSLKEASAGLGMFLGAIVGGLLPALFAGLFDLGLDGPAPYRYGLIVAVAVAFLGLAPLLRLAHVPSAPRTASARASWRSLRPLVPLVAAALLNHAAVASARVFYPAYLDRVFALPSTLIGLITSIGTLLAVAGSLSGPRLVARRGNSFGMMFASLGLTGSLLLMGLFGHWLAAGAGAIGMLALVGVWTPAYQVLQMELAEPAQRSLVAGVGWLGMSTGFTLMSFGGGQIVTALGYRPVFLLGATLSATSAVLMWRLSQRSRSTILTATQISETGGTE